MHLTIQIVTFIPPTSSSLFVFRSRGVISAASVGVCSSGISEAASSISGRGCFPGTKGEFLVVFASLKAIHVGATWSFSKARSGLFSVHFVVSTFNKSWSCAVSFLKASSSACALIAWSPFLIVSAVSPISSFRVASSSTSSETASSTLKTWWLLKLFLLSSVPHLFRRWSRRSPTWLSLLPLGWSIWHYLFLTFFFFDIILFIFQEAASAISTEAISPIFSKVDSAFPLKIGHLSFSCVRPLHFPLLAGSPFINGAQASLFLLNGDTFIFNYLLYIIFLLTVSSLLFYRAWSFAFCLDITFLLSYEA